MELISKLNKVGFYLCLLVVFNSWIGVEFDPFCPIYFDIDIYEDDIDSGLPYDPSFADLILNILNIYRCLVILF